MPFCTLVQGNLETEERALVQGNLALQLKRTPVQGNLALQLKRIPFINHRFDKLIGGKTVT